MVSVSQTDISEPFLCIITPIFDPALESLTKMISDLQRQTSADFCHIIISNGTSAKIKQLVEKIRRTDKRFIYDEIAQEPTTDHASLLINLGKRRRYCLEKYSASWYHFFDADAKIVDDDYIKKLKAQVGKQPQYDIFVNRIIHHGKLSEFPHDFDMANFSFSKKVAKNIPYPIDVDPRFPTGNDWRYFTMISTPTNTYFANDLIAVDKDGNQSYKRMSDKYREQDMASKSPISLFGNQFDNQELNAIKEVLDSHLVGYGQKVGEFEIAFKELIGFSQACATSSCTNAFWLLLRALKFKPEDEVIIPNIHFFGFANVLKILGIPFRICDVGIGVPNITLETLKPHINRHTRAIVFLEYGGYPVAIDSIKQYLKKIKRQDIQLILDAANSPFTKYKNAYTALSYDHVLYSFDMNKILVTGDGGMILTNQEALIHRVKSLSYYGLALEDMTGFKKSQHSDTWWEAKILEPSLKMAMNNIAASIGLVQLQKINDFLEKRAEIKQIYINKLQKIASADTFTLPPTLDKISGNVYFFWLQLKSQERRNQLARFLLKRGIYTNVKYQPLYMHQSAGGKSSTYKKARKIVKYSLGQENWEATRRELRLMSIPTPNAKHFFETSLCIPLHHNLSLDQADYIVGQIYNFFDDHDK